MVTIKLVDGTSVVVKHTLEELEKVIGEEIPNGISFMKLGKLIGFTTGNKTTRPIWININNIISIE